MMYSEQLMEELERKANDLSSFLESNRIHVKSIEVKAGPSVSLFKLYPAAGVKASSIRNLQDDISVGLHFKGVRISMLDDCIGMEIANDIALPVPLSSLLADDAFRNSAAELPVAMGYGVEGNAKVIDLAEAPHLLIAGATKQGKSVCVQDIIVSLLSTRRPEELKLALIDPKGSDFSAYKNLNRGPVVTQRGQAETLLQDICREMDRRYRLFCDAWVPNIRQWHQLGGVMPYIVVVIDEYSDLVSQVNFNKESRDIPKSIMASIVLLAQKGRAAGIHVILTTQRPARDVITGIIKANFPTRIAFRVSSREDSKTIIDLPGAERLIGRGDMLIQSGTEIERVQCAFIIKEDIEHFLNNFNESTCNEAVESDL